MNNLRRRDQLCYSESGGISHIAMRTIGLSVPARKAAHEPEEDMRLRVMALAASVLASAAVSTVSPVNGSFCYGVRSVYFYADVTTARLDKITDLFDRGRLITDVGAVLPLRTCASPTRCLPAD